MAQLEGSVGHQGENLSEDVRLVQRLLNQHNLAPLKPLPEDGRSAPPLVDSIRHFQVRYVGISSPDGRVDPEGRTFRKLALPTNQPGPGKNAEIRQADRELRRQYVDPRVKENGLTTQIIDKLLPHFRDIRARIISGYLSDSDLFWKVNYHWEYLLQTVEHSLTLALEDKWKSELGGIRGGLLAYPPDPDRGYTSGALGKPEDRSPYDDIKKRYEALASGKRTFREIIDDAKLKEKSKKSGQVFDLAAAPVAFPGTSKHSTGFALDIQGDNAAIKNVCRQHGATLVFDEQSHVHVEFKNG